MRQNYKASIANNQHNMNLNVRNPSHLGDLSFYIFLVSKLL